MPPASPAAIMFEKSASKVFGCFFIASASAAPASTSSRVFRMTAEKPLCGSCLPRMSRHCTSGRPASIMTENWRAKIARFLAGTLAPPFFARLRLGLGLRLDRVDLGDLDLLAPERRDRRVHRVRDALAGDRLPGARPSCVSKCRHNSLALCYQLPARVVARLRATLAHRRRALAPPPRPAGCPCPAPATTPVPRRSSARARPSATTAPSPPRA